ncbi:hypothetical protein EJ06DRAFT_216469 [Trichodelitschia bisporula]|uniref:Uncharacterized protein n=1 Tax=Trichodelitschia bisporula TaxID=703511 RepID=A0A6G1I9P3_9PEZI|nr:hypothetical protein EJ06DRAFT_216469 [Trichodelitschia bisporula]
MRGRGEWREVGWSTCASEDFSSGDAMLRFPARCSAATAAGCLGRYSLMLLAEGREGVGDSGARRRGEVMRNAGRGGGRVQSILARMMEDDGVVCRYFTIPALLALVCCGMLLATLGMTGGSWLCIVDE